LLRLPEWMLRLCGNSVNASTTVFRRRDNGEKCRIHKLQEQTEDTTFRNFWGGGVETLVDSVDVVI
jgi:hypothetical protein